MILNRNIWISIIIALAVCIVTLAWQRRSISAMRQHTKAMLFGESSRLKSLLSVVATRNLRKTAGGYARYSRLNEASRFSTNALTPSFASSEPSMRS